MTTQAPATSDLTLTPPPPIDEAPPEEATSVRLDRDTAARLDGVVSSYVDSLLTSDPHSEGFTRKVNAIHALGNEEIRKSASVSNRMLERPVGAIKHSLGSTSPVAQALVQLRRTVEDLDPSRKARRIRGGLFGKKLRDYFAQYQSAQGHLNAIVQALYRGQDELLKDNATIEQEKTNLWAVMDRLRQYLYLARKLDGALAARIADVEKSDPERARNLQEDCLFYARQKSQDLATQLAVSAQGYMALELVRKNNLELIKGVDRATTTTVSALRTAVMVAQALLNQKLVLDQIGALNTTTADMIEGTSALLRQQSAAVHEQAASATVSLEKLQAAFNNIYATIDSIDAYKLQALDSMRQTVDALSREITRAQAYLERSRESQRSELGAATDELRLPGASG